MVLLALVAVAPSAFLLLWFYLADRYEPEPRGHVLAAFALGAAAMGAAVLADRLASGAVGGAWLDEGGLGARSFEAFVLAGALEEGCKWVAFLAVVYRWAEFDEPVDGVVYGVALALGFASVENALYVVRGGLRLGILRALFAVPAHALFGATMGGFLGRAKLGRGRHQRAAVAPARRNLLVAAALVVPALLHGLYDFLLLALIGASMYAAVTAGSVALWAWVLRRVHRAREDSPFKH
jgi:RsiW-degrading membrane proteinase PrsW (M82 family)